MSGQNAPSYLFRGGLDLASPPVAIKPGTVLGGYNYEPVDEGYRRIGGNEIYDGSVLPHATLYWTLAFDNGSVAISAGDTVEGGTSGDVGVAVLDAILVSGTYGAGDAAGYVVLSVKTGVAGPFQDGEDLEVSSSKVAEADGIASERGAATVSLDFTYLSAAHDYWRATVSAPAGTGPVRGVNFYTDYTNFTGAICFRDNGGAGTMLENSAGTGWTAVGLGETLDFTTGTTGPFTVGTVVTGGTSGATATVREVVTQSGAWSGTAAGYLVISNRTGDFQAETITATGASATASGIQSAIALPTGGRYRFVNANVRATTELRRMYFANGVGRAHEVSHQASALRVVPIRVPGLTAGEDMPTHIAEFKNHLFLAYANGVIRHSSIETPLEFRTTTGAGEIGFGDEPTGFMVAGSVLVIFGRRRISYITGSSAADFVMVPLSTDNGAWPDTMQLVDTPHYFDGQALRRLTQTEALGGWRMGQVAPQIERLWGSKRKIGATPVASWRVQGRNQWVVALSDGTGVTVYLGRKIAEVLPFRLDFQPFCSVEIDHSEGFLSEDAVLVGAEDGNVYLMDRGRSFDGDPIEYLLILSYIGNGAGVYRKNRWHKLRVGAAAPEGTVTLSLTAEYGFGDEAIPSSVETDVSVFGGGGRWDLANWDEFYWSTPEALQGEAMLSGISYNVGLALGGEAAFEAAHVLTWFTIYSTVRGQDG